MKKGEDIKTDRQVQQCSVLLSGCENFWHVNSSSMSGGPIQGTSSSTSHWTMCGTWLTFWGQSIVCFPCTYTHVHVQCSTSFKKSVCIFMSYLTRTIITCIPCLDATLVRRLASTSPGQGSTHTSFTTLPLLESSSCCMGCPKSPNQGTPLRKCM